MRGLFGAACLLVSAGAIALAPDPAAADRPDPRARQAAKRHAEEAAAAYQDGRFGAALEEYEHAYRIAPVPEVLFNLGQCQFQLGHYERAILYYRQYLAGRPDAPNRALVEDLIAEARDRMEGGRSSPALVAASAPVAVAGLAERDPGQTRDRAPVRPALVRRWWFWTAVGAAVIAAGSGAVFLAGRSNGALPERSLGTVDGR